MSPTRYARRFERSRTDRMIGGVCGGAARYLNMDPTLVRIMTVVLALFSGVTIPVYIVLLFLLPEEAPVDHRQVRPTGPDPVWGPEGAPWEQPVASSAPPADQPARPAGEPWRPTPPAARPTTPWRPTTPAAPQDRAADSPDEQH